MPKQRIHTDNAPQPGGTYSQGIEADGWIYVAGQVPIDPATGEFVEADIKVQTDRVLKNLKAIVEAGGATIEDVVKTTVFLDDLSEFGEMNEIYGQYFSGDMPPARATVEVAALPKGCKIEVDAVAKK
ncbi:MAG: RidA family protein [Planctomycetota bacterium]|jgi:2-iminobutanoate/2-iminopropanoate deaminase|nr:RidA family protein [Planctomycetota bacterium]MDP6355550.1 RidA family protein [Planctomycetota bacterium]MDP7253753.1 RidA family protein [Planctomycetota bacterium]